MCPKKLKNMQDSYQEENVFLFYRGLKFHRLGNFESWDKYTYPPVLF